MSEDERDFKDFVGVARKYAREALRLVSRPTPDWEGSIRELEVAEAALELARECALAEIAARGKASEDGKIEAHSKVIR